VERVKVIKVVKKKMVKCKCRVCGEEYERKMYDEGMCDKCWNERIDREGR